MGNWHTATYKHIPSGETRDVTFSSRAQTRKGLKRKAFNDCIIDTLFHSGETAFGDNSIITMISLDGNAW